MKFNFYNCDPPLPSLCPALSCDSQQYQDPMNQNWSQWIPAADQIIQSENLCLHQISKIVNKFWENDSLLFIRRHSDKEFTFLQKLDKFSFSFSINATQTILSKLGWCRDALKTFRKRLKPVDPRRSWKDGKIYFTDFMINQCYVQYKNKIDNSHI